MRRLPSGVAIGLVVLLLVAGGAAVYLAGGPQNPFVHLMYLPVLLAAVTFGVVGGVVAGLAAMLVLGPLMPFDVATGEAQPTVNWLMRGGFFVLTGGLAGAIRQRFERELAETSRAVDLERALRESEHARQQLAEQVLAFGAHEHSRVALLLHDRVMPHFTVAGLQLEIASGGVADHEMAERLQTSAQALQRGTAELRGFMSRLSESVVEPGQLADSVDGLVARLQQEHGIEVETTVEPTGELALAAEIAAVEVVREGLSNVSRHAAADAVRVSIGRDDGAISVHVHDDGRGFDPQVLPEGHGLELLRRRLALAGGALEIDSAPGDGTTVRARIPV